MTTISSTTPAAKPDWLRQADRLIMTWIARYRAVAACRKSLEALRADVRELPETGWPETKGWRWLGNTRA